MTISLKLYEALIQHWLARHSSLNNVESVTIYDQQVSEQSNDDNSIGLEFTIRIEEKTKETFVPYLKQLVYNFEEYATMLTEQFDVE